MISKLLSSTLLVLLLLVTVACDKATPKKVERKIVKDSWVVNNMMFQGTDVTNSFKGYRLGFAKEDGEIIVYLDNITTEDKGQWLVGEDKKPTKLYLSGFFNTPLDMLNDDWTVNSCTSDEIKMQSDNAVNTVELKRLEP